jgi:hypothetical protein
MFDMLPDRIELFLRPFFRLHKRTCKGRRPFEETRHSFGSRAKLGTICTWQPRNHASRNPRYLTLGTWYCNSTRGANMSRAKCGMEVLADSAFFLGGSPLDLCHSDDDVSSIPTGWQFCRGTGTRRVHFTYGQKPGTLAVNSVRKS